MVNVLPGKDTNTSVTQFRTDLLTAVSGSSSSAPATTYFSAAQITQMQGALSTTSGFTTPQANQVINAVSDRLAASGTSSSSLPALNSANAAATIVNTIAPALSPTATSANSIDNNKSAGERFVQKW